MKRRKHRKRNVRSLAKKQRGRNKGAASQRRNAHATKKDVRLKTPEDRLFWKLVGAALVALAALMALALSLIHI